MLANENMIQNEDKKLNFEDEILGGILRHKNAIFCCGDKNAMFSAVIHIIRNFLFYA